MNKIELTKFNNLFNNIIFQYSIVNEQNNVYIVKKGDTLSKISSLVKVSIDDLCTLNNINDSNKIKVGQKLLLSNSNNNIQKKQNSDNNFLKDKNLSQEDYKKIYFIARVLYSQTGTKTTDDEVKKVATVIYNRTKNKQAFPKVENVFDAVNNKSQFSCINDKQNSNWWEFKPDLNDRTKNAMNIAYQLYTNTFTPIDNNQKFSQKYYMYIDHSLSNVPSQFYAKKYWNLVKLPQTDHFKFYSLKPKKS